MSKRNFILLILILVFVVAGVFGFLYLRSGTTPVDVVSDGTNFLSQFNPFSSDNTNESTNGKTAVDINGDGVLSEEEISLSLKLKKISSIPIAGFAVFSKERLKDVPTPAPVEPTPQTQTEGDVATTPKTVKKPAVKAVAPATEFAQAVRYVEKSTGNIYQTFTDKIEERRFSETIIPKIYDAYFGNNGQSVVMRHLKSDEATIETFSGTMPKEKVGEDLTDPNVKGYFLVDNIKDISVSPDNSKIFYLSNFGESTIGTIMGLNDGKKVQVFDSAFTEWNSFWPNNNIITLTTKPSGEVAGQMYMLDVVKKTFSRILGNINGLTTLMSPNGKLVLVGNKDLSLYLYNTDTKVYVTLGVKTLPEKCTWNKNSEFIYCAVPAYIDDYLYPDDWYRGEVSFSDQIWKINIVDGSTNILTDPLLIPGGEDIDGTKLALDANEDYLFFINKKDSFLWELGLR